MRQGSLKTGSVSLLPQTVLLWGCLDLVLQDFRVWIGCDFFFLQLKKLCVLDPALTLTPSCLGGLLPLGWRWFLAFLEAQRSQGIIFFLSER